jgi:transposase
MAKGIGVGIDVSKETLDVATSDRTVTLHVTNDAEGFECIIAALRDVAVHRVLLEASGGYERGALIALFEAGLPVVLVQPVRARNFARALGRRAKTDPIDAAVLAMMAALVVDDVPLWAPTEDALADLEALVERRQNLIVVRDAERKRLRLARSIVRADIETLVTELTAKIADLERRIDEIIAEVTSLADDAKVLESVKGVGRISAATLLVSLPELGTLTRGEIAALAGVAPMNRDSGSWSGQRFIHGGRAQARNALYMMALTGTRWNPVIRERYAYLRSKGKKPKVALVACMRKLLIHLNGLMRIHKNGPTMSALQLS